MTKFPSSKHIPAHILKKYLEASGCDDIENPPFESSIPTCPYDWNVCIIEEIHDQFKHHDDFMGVLPICNICVKHKQLAAMNELVSELKVLRGTKI